ncbi:hypothetical protein [Gordonia alkanivorans]|uniref:Uncharacterized protein n=1 Tax=Gordonia alkanivorans NBRC 16433 TaxID=1027371 RepID=F9VVF1_9ACTN|nr:hypothetical protein [Gordonia alkanivorans]GAA12580.1 hypothetical protein GOALK_056_00130 [Gordonia alkanivorans NBRC 16433]
MNRTPRRRQATVPVGPMITPLAEDDDLIVDLLHEALGVIEPEDISDLLDLADLIGDVDEKRITAQTIGGVR